MNSVSSLEGKVAIVTGAGQGMGEHFARFLDVSPSRPFPAVDSPSKDDSPR